MTWCDERRHNSAAIKQREKVAQTPPSDLDRFMLVIPINIEYVNYYLKNLKLSKWDVDIHISEYIITTT